MQLWLCTNVDTGTRGLGFAGKAGRYAEDEDEEGKGEETNIVVMKPDMAARLPCEALSLVRRASAVWSAFRWLARQSRGAMRRTHA